MTGWRAATGPPGRAWQRPAGSLSARARSAVDLHRALSMAPEAARGLAATARVSRPGTFVAVVFFCLSVTPSLLPRTWQVQGIISGFSASFGYGAGVIGAWLWSRIVRGRLRVSQRLSTTTRLALPAGAVGLATAFLYQGSRWQRDLYALMGERPPSRLTYLGVLLLTVLLVAAVVGVARGLRATARLLTRLLRRWVPPALARLAGVAVVGLASVILVDGVVHDGFLSLMSATSARTDATIAAFPAAPTAATRSGSPASLVSWESLGRQGRSFVAGGPTVEQLRRFGGPSAREPIRVYVGLKSAPTVSQAAALAVRELDRTGAFSRSVLCVISTTGTGWVDPYLAAALEYLHNGNTAMVGIQYSYLPSWIFYLTERERAEQAGRELFNQVYARWSALPAGHRPRLVVFGESLGSLGSEAAFRDLDDVRARTGGALWAGPINANPLWRDLVARRDPGSTEVRPIYGHGTTVRFAARPEDLQRPAGEWPAPRVVYLQNPSDPVTWWSPQLLLRRPDWLAERPGDDVLPAMRWYPFVTFLQVTADLALAEDAPAGHGHDFDRAAVAAWAAIAPPAGWTPARTAELTRLLNQTYADR